MKRTSGGPLAVLLAVLLAVVVGAGDARAASGGQGGADGSGGTGGAGSASAPLPGPEDGWEGGDSQGAARAAGAEAVRAYWTPERMRHAEYQGGGLSRGGRRPAVLS